MPRRSGFDSGTAGSGTSKMVRSALVANHFLHWASSLIVMSIAAYFIHKFRRDQHLIYWVTIGAIDAFLYTFGMILPLIKAYKGYLSPLAWIFSYLWLTAFIFAAQDYNWHQCHLHSPGGVGKCGLKKTLEAFAFLAFITNLIGLLLEWKLWDNQRFKNNAGTMHGGDKLARPSGDTATTATGAPVSTV